MRVYGSHNVLLACSHNVLPIVYIYQSKRLRAHLTCFSMELEGQSLTGVFLSFEDPALQLLAKPNLDTCCANIDNLSEEDMMLEPICSLTVICYRYESQSPLNPNFQ